MQTGTPSITRDTQSVYEGFFSGVEGLENEAYVLAAGVTSADASNDLLADTAVWHDIASQIEVDGMFNVNSTSVLAWTALLSHLNEADMPYLSASDGTISLEGGTADTHPVSRTTVAGDPSANLYPIMSRVGTHTRLSQEQIEALATEIVAQVKARGPFLSLSEFVNRQLSSSDLELARAGTIEAALIKLSEMGADTKNPFAELQSAFTQVEVKGSPAFQQAAEGNVAYGFPGWVRQADVLRPIAPVLSARDDTFVIRAYGERKNPITGKTSAQAWCEAVVQRRADYVDPADAATALPGDATLNSEANKRFGRRFSIISFRWLSPDEV